MRCDQCNKFVSYDDGQEPEAELDLDDGQVTGTVRVVLPCAECGQELKEGTFDVDVDIREDLEKHNREKHADKISKDEQGNELIEVDNFEVEMNGCEMKTRTKGKGRWTETFYGHSTEFCVNCSLCPASDNGVVCETIEDDLKASSMDELI